MFNRRTVNSITVNDVDCEVEHEPVQGSELTAQVGDKIIIAYNVYDNDARLEDLMGDCMGKLISFHRHANNHEEGLAALGNTCDGEPDLDAVWGNHQEVATELYLAKIRSEESFADVRGKFADRQGNGPRSWNDAMKTLTDDTQFNDWGNVIYWELMEEVLKDMWAEPEFFPGDRDAELLSCYEHGGQVWSLSGSGMQCRWDTSNRAGVWVPDDYLRKELDGTAPGAVWAVVKNTSWIRGTGKSYQLVKHEWVNDKLVNVVSVEFSDDCSDLHAKARAIGASMPSPTPKQVAWGREQQAEIYCKQFLSTYNDIINGNVYGCVVETFDLEGVQIDKDSCWGFVGDYAEQALKEEFFDPACERQIETTQQLEQTCK